MVISNNAVLAKSSLMPIMTLIVTTAAKALWKTMEMNYVAVVPFAYQHQNLPEPQLRVFPSLYREYSRLSPGVPTLYAPGDRQYMLAAVFFTSVCLEVAIYLLAITTSLSLGSGYNVDNLKRTPTQQCHSCS